MSNTDLRAKLTVTADASSLVSEMRRGSEGLREMRRETEAAAAAAAHAATEQGRMAERLNRSFGSATPKSARESFGVFEAQREYEAFTRAIAQQASRSWRALAESMDPVKRAARELAEAQQIANRAVELGAATNTEAARALQQLEDRYRAVVRSHSPAAQSAMAMERAIEEETEAVRQLTLALDPAARAAAEMTAVQDRLTRAVRMGITTQEEASRILTLLEARQRQVGAGGISMGMGIQNASYQIADFAIQVQAGQAASLALAQQLPQLLGGFGVLGAVLGAVVAVGAPLAKMLFSTADAAGSLDDRMKRLETSISRVNDHLKILRDENLGHTFGNMANDVRDMSEAMLELERISMLRATRDSLKKLMTEQTDPTWMQRRMIELAMGQATGPDAPSQDDLLQDVAALNFRRITGGRGPDFQEFNARRELIDTLLEANKVKDAIAEINRLIQDFRDAGPLSETGQEFQQMLRTLGDIAKQAAETEASLNGSAEAAKTWSGLVETVGSIWDDARAKGREVTAEAEERIRIAESELVLAQVIARHGNDSREARVERNRIEREAYELELQRASIFPAEREHLLNVFDQTQRTRDATADWADRMATVRSEVSGILSSLASLGGSVVDRAARAAELQALNAGETVAEAAARGAAVRREAEQQARLMAASGPLGRVTARLQNWWQDGGVEQNAQLDAARAASREREREANRRGSSPRSSASAGASIMEELARLVPSYENDVAAADAWREKALEGLKKTRDGYARFAADVEQIYQERLQKAYEDDLSRRDDWAAGVERGLLEVEDGLGTWADTAEELVTGWAKRGEDAFVRFGMTGKASIGDMVDFMLEQFLRLAFQQNIAPGMNMLANSAVSWIGGFLPGGAGAAAPVKTKHTGSPGVMRSYALPGFGDRMRPDEHLTMIRDGEEVMTSRALENAGALISNLSSIASRSGAPAAVAVQTPPMQVTINDYSGAGVEAQQDTDSRGNPTLTMTVGRQVGAAIGQSGNPAARAIEQKYGVRQRGIPR